MKIKLICITSFDTHPRAIVKGGEYFNVEEFKHKGQDFFRVIEVNKRLSNHNYSVNLLKTIEAPADCFKEYDILEGQEFFNLMQAYRDCTISFEDIKKFIRENLGEING